MRRFHHSWVYLVLILASCSSDRLPEGGAANQPPTVWLTADDPKASGDSYSVHFEWGGLDPDGKVSHFEFLIVDNADGSVDPENLAGDWTKVSETSSTMNFPIEPSEDEDIATESSHTFFIRAVDNEMLPSTEPDYIVFTPKSLAPGVRITVPATSFAAVLPVSTFEWGPHYQLAEPDSVQWAMVNTSEHNNSYLETIAYLRTLASAPDWYPWVWYDAPATKASRGRHRC